MRPGRWRGEGILLACSPLPLLSAWLGVGPEANTLLGPPLWRLCGAGFAFALAVFGAWGLRRFPRSARAGLFGSVLASIAVMGQLLVAHPALSLVLLLLTILGAFSLFEGGLGFLFGPDDNLGRSLQRARSTMLGTMLLGAAFEILRLPEGPPEHLVLGISAGLVALQAMIWCFGAGAGEPLRKRLRAVAASVLALLVLPLGLSVHDLAPLLALAMLAGLALMPRSSHRLGPQRPWWEPLVDHPARVLISTFFGLCALGTALLLIPAASLDESLAQPIDAAFTAVSAVCVTGLIVVDTATQLTGFGQAIVLLLIQMGGLGIMTISTVALSALGRRLSLRQERLMTEISDSPSSDLQSSLLNVVKFTVATEMTGALLLSLLFWSGGDGLGEGLWRGVFTSISAFCNAGFALQSESLVPYAENPLVLYVVSFLIIAGGMAPATCIALPRLLRRRRVSVAVKIVAWSTLLLLATGTIGFLALEWNKSLSELPFLARLHNAWFQSTTLRTAGFNSVDISAISPGTMMLMLGFMFIGGSPGGTAGGVKTTTVAILCMTMWAGIKGHNEVLIGRRTISRETVHKAVAILGSSVFVWISTLLCLILTQSLDARDLVFEATSALGTVGLSTGITSSLDDVGKIVVLIAMFAGRVGPMTFLALLGGSRDGRIQRPEAQVPLT